jgi:hypothetical protein
MSQATIDEWESETPKGLPEHVKTAGLRLIGDELGLEKTAILGSVIGAMSTLLGGAAHAGGTHVAQNAALQGLTKAPGIAPMFGKFLGNSFRRGVKGEPIGTGTSFAGGLLGGAALPEVHALSRHAHEVGAGVNRGLRSRGVKELTPRDMVLGRAITEGRFSQLATSPRYHMTPAFHSMMQVAEKQSGIPIRKYLSQAAYGKNAAEKAAAVSKLQEIEKVWADPKKSPFTANIMSNFTRGSTSKLGNMPINEARHSAVPDLAHMAGSALGAVGMAHADPITAGLNTVKTLATNPTSRNAINKNGMASRFMKWMENGVLKRPVTDRFENSFVHGKSPELPLGKKLWNTYGKNALAENLSQSAGHIGLAAGQGTPQNVKQLAVNQARNTRKLGGDPA